ncbi:M48 family metalloprotease [Bosea sp. ANAM02]|uniref:M48 family metalloprotease n=1 Tax=Bosea sp. ANAM02 TaxID=2020412 RepID=UPI00140F1ACC|nr:M48 family metalloprotease [Bosea sp. ANAM02]BCB21957.1 hypothetical protein OCUBac02_48510 [Bosea sp. ANAM02]
MGSSLLRVAYAFWVLATPHLFSPSAAEAQERTRIDFDAVPTIHFPAGSRVVSAYPAFEDYAHMLFDLCDALKLSSKECSIFPMNAKLGGNALATLVDGNRIIVYDRELSGQVGYDGAEMIIAHELGHHRCGHLGKAADTTHELQADAFAGAAARLRGKTLKDALSAVPLFSKRPGRTHPSSAARVAAITAGWNNPEAGRACRLPD